LAQPAKISTRSWWWRQKKSREISAREKDEAFAPATALESVASAAGWGSGQLRLRTISGEKIVHAKNMFEVRG
jgi:hypothetical protein